MPAFVVGLLSIIFGSIVKALLFVVGYMVFRVLLLLGFSYVIYKGLDAYVFRQYDKIKGLFGQLPDFVMTSLGIMGADVYISIILSAIVLRFSVKAASKITFFG